MAPISAGTHATPVPAYGFILISFNTPAVLVILSDIECGIRRTLFFCSSVHFEGKESQDALLLLSDVHFFSQALLPQLAGDPTSLKIAQDVAEVFTLYEERLRAVSSGTSRLSTHEREIVRSIAKNARNARHSLGHVSEGASLALDRAYAAGANIEKQLISFADILQKRPVLRNATGTAMRTDKMKPNGLGELEETPKRSSLSNTTEPTIGVEKTEPNVLSKPQDHRSQTLPKQPALPNAINPTNPTIGMETMNPNGPNKPVEQPPGNPVSTAPRPLGSPMKFAIVGLVGNKPFGVFTPEEAYIHAMEIERQNNHAEAADLYKEAAACGHVPSMVALGRRLIGIDDRTAAGWFLAAAESGSAMGWTELGYMYSQGYGVERSSTRGTACRKRAAFLNGKLANSCDKRVARAAPVSDQRWSGSTSTG